MMFANAPTQMMARSVPESATLYLKVPPKTASMQVQLTYVDGTTSPARSFTPPK